ncbi:hypothetical protein EGW08_008353, partial [Elysia chlorotica]
ASSPLSSSVLENACLVSNPVRTSTKSVADCCRCVSSHPCGHRAHCSCLCTVSESQGVLSQCEAKGQKQEDSDNCTREKGKQASGHTTTLSNALSQDKSSRICSPMVEVSAPATPQVVANMAVIQTPSAETTSSLSTLQVNNSVSTAQARTALLANTGHGHVVNSLTGTTNQQYCATESSSRSPSVRPSVSTAASSSPCTPQFQPIEHATGIRSITKVSPGKSIAPIWSVKRARLSITNSPGVRLLEDVTPSQQSLTNELPNSAQQFLTASSLKSSNLKQANCSEESAVLPLKCLEKSAPLSLASPVVTPEGSDRSLSSPEPQSGRRSLVGEYCSKGPISKVANRRKQRLELGEYEIRMRERRDKPKDSTGKFVCKDNTVRRQSLRSEVKNLLLDSAPVLDNQGKVVTEKCGGDDLSVEQSSSNTRQKQHARPSHSARPRPDKQPKESTTSTRRSLRVVNLVEHSKVLEKTCSSSTSRHDKEDSPRGNVNITRPISESREVDSHREPISSLDESCSNTKLSLKLFKKFSPLKGAAVEEEKYIVKKKKHSTWIREVAMSENCGVEVILASDNLMNPSENVDPPMYLSLDSRSVISSPGTPCLTIDLSADEPGSVEKPKPGLNRIPARRRNQLASAIDQKSYVKGRELSAEKSGLGRRLSSLEGETSSDGHTHRKLRDSECLYVKSVPLASLQALFSEGCSHTCSSGNPDNPCQVVPASGGETDSGLGSPLKKRLRYSHPGDSCLPEPVRNKVNKDSRPRDSISTPKELKSSGGKRKKPMADKRQKSSRQAKGQRAASSSRANRKQTTQTQEGPPSSSSIQTRGQRDGTPGAGEVMEDRRGQTTESQDRQLELEKAVAVLEGCLAAEDAGGLQHPGVSPVKHLPLKKRHSFDFQPVAETWADRPPVSAGFHLEQNNRSSERQIGLNSHVHLSKLESKTKSLSLARDQRSAQLLVGSSDDKLQGPQDHLTPKPTTYSQTEVQQEVRWSMGSLSSQACEASLSSEGSCSSKPLDFKKITPDKIKALMKKLYKTT